MILLSEIDHHRVLDGARVPITDTTPNPDRWEWIGDRLLRFYAEGTPTIAEMHVELYAQWLALDPADLDVARVLDRKIAEALNHTPFAPSEGYAIRTGFQSDWAQTPCFFMAQIAAEDGHTLEHECLHGIAIEPANIPAARAALIRALYSAVKA